MANYSIFAVQRECDPHVSACSFLVGSLCFTEIDLAHDLAKALRALKEEQRIVGEATWERVNSPKIDYYRCAIELFLASPARLSVVFSSAERLPFKGRCSEIYRVYRESITEWLLPGDTVTLLVNSDFETISCGGADCKFVYVGGSECKAAFGRPVSRQEAHLRIADLSAVLERTASPRAKVVAQKAEEQDNILLSELVGLLLGAIDYAFNGLAGSVAKQEICEMLAAHAGASRLFDIFDNGAANDKVAISELSRPIKHESQEACSVYSSELFDPDSLPVGEQI